MVPGTNPEKLIAFVENWWHRAWFATAFTVGVGFTVMLNEVELPVQVSPALVKAGVIVTVAVTGEFVVFVAVNEEISPVPAAPRPMVVFELTQL